MTNNLPAPAALSGTPLTEWRATRGLRTALTWLLALDIVVALVVVAAHLNRVSVIDDLKSFSATLDDAQAADDFVQSSAWIYLVPVLATSVVWIVWQWRSAKNNELLGRIRPRMTAGWSIGGWFIPIANLIIPVRILQDLWQGSDPAVSNYQEWRGLQRSRLVGWWWTAYLLGNIVAFNRYGEQTLDQLRQADQINAMGALLTCVAAVLAIFVVRSITERQEIARAATRPSPSGWFADPTGRFDHRYWDGSSWTTHASRNGELADDPIA